MAPLNTGILPGQLYLCESHQETRGRKRTYHEDRASYSIERSRKHKKKKSDLRKENIATLDFETDPFDNTKPNETIFPFAACLYSLKFDPVVIWENDREKFVAAVMKALENLEGDWTVYAHNGGKFDYMFFLHKLRGRISFKGRGIMSAKLPCKYGSVELRDSFHILPEKLANLEKDTSFDYSTLSNSKREKHRDRIIEYMISDCKYLHSFVMAFVNRLGMKISIGQAAMYELKKHYPNLGRLAENADATLRQWFFGGRVECLAGGGHFQGHYKLFDVNSMYPHAMASFRHPVSSNYTLRRRGDITENTVFLELECTNRGALIRKDENGETTATEKRGTFKTTIWEYQAAQELNLIRDVKITGFIDNDELTTFEKFVTPFYETRLRTKEQMKAMERAGLKETFEYKEQKKDDLLTKYLLNNAYGKFAQNPRKFKEFFLTAPDEHPEGDEWKDQIFPALETPEYWIWSKPILKPRFNNVGTAASITGAARSVLLRAIHSAVDPIYCDTDSLICRDLKGVEIHSTKLGAWDLEAEYSEVIINGKKLYACKPLDWSDGQEARIKIKSKGASGLTWDDMQKMLLHEPVVKVNRGVTITKSGKQFYMARTIKNTAPFAHGVAA